jgi:hypothetical protein
VTQLETKEEQSLGVYRNAREEIISRYNGLWEQQQALKAAIEKYIDDFGQMPLSDQAREGLHFGMAHVIDSYTKIHCAALHMLREG